MSSDDCAKKIGNLRVLDTLKVENIIGKNILITSNKECGCNDKTNVTIDGFLEIIKDLFIKGNENIKGNLTVNGTTKACNLKTQNITPCSGPGGTITVNGDINTSGAINACNIYIKQVFVNPFCPSCPSDPTNNTIFFNAEVAASPINIPPGIKPYSVFKADQCSNENADITLVIAPKGTGALVADEPDGTAIGGNDRGLNAVDLQMRRVSATQVASGSSSVIGGGVNNSNSGGVATIGGGFNNTITSSSSTISGGQSNNITSSSSTIGGGQGNRITSANSTIGGGSVNNVSGGSATVAGGASNLSSGGFSTVSGGQQNTSSNNSSFIGGGGGNLASAPFSTISGGQLNTTSNSFSTVPGGRQNNAEGIDSFAAGYNAKALNNNTFVYGAGPGLTTTNATNQVIFNVSGVAFTPPVASVPLSPTFYINGNLAVTGVTNLLMDHPILANKSLFHSSIEAPRPDLIYRGTVQLINGRADVNIDGASNMTEGTFSQLTKNVDAYLTNKTKNSWDLVKIEDHDILSTGKFTIISNNNLSNAIVSWLVIAERKLEHISLIEVDRPKVNPEIFNNYEFKSLSDDLTFEETERILEL